MYVRPYVPVLLSFVCSYVCALTNLFSELCSDGQEVSVAMARDFFKVRRPLANVAHVT